MTFFIFEIGFNMFYILIVIFALNLMGVETLLLESEINGLSEYAFAERVTAAVKHDPTYVSRLRAFCETTRVSCQERYPRHSVELHFGGKIVGDFLLKEVLEMLEESKSGVEVEKCAYERLFDVLSCVSQSKMTSPREEFIKRYTLNKKAKDAHLVNVALRDLCSATKAVCAHIRKTDVGVGYEVWDNNKLLGCLLGYV